MRCERLAFAALGGIAALLAGIALLLEDECALFAPVLDIPSLGAGAGTMSASVSAIALFAARIGVGPGPFAAA
jgi:hypothetical protein